MLMRTLLQLAVIGVALSQTLVLKHLSGDVEHDGKGGKIIRPNVTVTTSQRRVFVPKGKSLKFGDSPILKLTFQPSPKLSKALSFSAPSNSGKDSKFFHLVPSTPAPENQQIDVSTSLTPIEPAPVRSVHHISNTTYQMPADFLCEGLVCSKGQQCSLAQPVCTPEDCSLKPSCSKKLSDHCEKCQPPCVHAVLNLNAEGGCHPCLCEVTVFRPPPRLAKRLAQLTGV